MAKRIPVIDADGSGAINLDEFLGAAKELVAEEAAVKDAREASGWTEAETDAFRELFVQYDDDGSGTLETQELVEVCGAFGFHIPAHSVASLMEPYDIDGGGSLDFCEFLHFLRDASEKFPKHEDDMG